MADASLNEIDGVPLYKPNDPYHHDFDNKPIKTLVERDKLILGIVNVLKASIENAGGNLGDLSLRINQSIDPNGNLKVSAIDESNHNIANHNDGRKQISQQELDYYLSLGYNLSNNPKFVRMIEEERAKLSLIADEANKLNVAVSNEDVDKHVIDNGEVIFQSSDTIDCIVENNNTIKFNSKFPVNVAHQHYYNVNPTTSDRIQYSINGVNSFKEGSLRVYVNGFRIQECPGNCEDINYSYYSSFVINNSTITPVWKKVYYSENASNGKFSFSSALSVDDKVVIDYDIVLI